MSRPRIELARPIGACVAAALLAGTLVGCSDMYFDRRDSIALGAGDAVAADRVMQMNDPWPRQSGNASLAFNGQRMQSAVERYRNNVTTQPVDPMQIEVSNQSPATAQVNVSNAPPPTQSIGSGSNSTTTQVVTTPQPSQ